MAYRIKGKNGLPIKKDGQFLMGYDIPETKIEQLDEKNLSFLAVGSTEDEDRDKDIVRVDGWKLANFQKNPVLPWGHNYWEPPVGKAVSIKKDKTKKKLIFKAQFDGDDDKARLIFNKYKNGYLNTFSVGFIGLEFNLREEGNYWGGKEFIKQELLEISPVTVPSNPNANMDIRGMNDDLPPTLAAQGFKQFMCKTDSGLFIPVTDTEIYTDHIILPVAKGVNGLYAKTIDNPEAEKELVGYLFKSDTDEKEAQWWVNDHGCNVSKVKYFDMSGKQIGEEEFELDVVEEEIKPEEEKGIETEETDENELTEEELEMDEEENKGEEEIENKEEENKSESSKETEEKMEDEEMMEEDMECMVEMTISMKDMDGKEMKSKKKKKKMMMNEVDMDEMMKRAFSKDKEKEFSFSEDDIKQIVQNELKKSVETEEEIDNNENDDSEIELSDETDESKSGEVIEFDASLFSPVNEDSSEDLIEIDEKVFEEVKSQIKTKGNLKNALEESIKNALRDFSGKLDD